MSATLKGPNPLLRIGHIVIVKGMFMDKFVSADTDQSPQIHLDLEQTVTEYYSFPRSRY
jgi:hypothetical protein